MSSNLENPGLTFNDLKIWTSTLIIIIIINKSILYNLKTERAWLP